MIFYDFHCDACDNLEEKEFDSFNDFDSQRFDHKILCSKCGEETRRSYSSGSSSIYIPEHMQAGTESGNSFDFAKHTFSRGKRPSGKDKIYW
jgi:hypothetical protein